MMFIESVSANDHTKVIVPPLPFSASDGQRIALTLVSLGLRRTFYNVNHTNNKFLFIVQGDPYLITIPPGAYQTFEELRTALAMAFAFAIANTPALAAEVTSVAVAYDHLTRFFTFSISQPDTAQRTYS